MLAITILGARLDDSTNKNPAEAGFLLSTAPGGAAGPGAARRRSCLTGCRCRDDNALHRDGWHLGRSRGRLHSGHGAAQHDGAHHEGEERCDDTGLGGDGFLGRSFCLVRCDGPNCRQRDCCTRAACDELRKARRELQARLRREIGAFCSSFRLLVVSSRWTAFGADFGESMANAPMVREFTSVTQVRNARRAAAAAKSRSRH